MNADMDKNEHSVSERGPLFALRRNSAATMQMCHPSGVNELHDLPASCMRPLALLSLIIVRA
jgi:hypothetical protein